MFGKASSSISETVLTLTLHEANSCRLLPFYHNPLASHVRYALSLAHSRNAVPSGFFTAQQMPYRQFEDAIHVPAVALREVTCHGIGVFAATLIATARRLGLKTE